MITINHLFARQIHQIAVDVGAEKALIAVVLHQTKDVVLKRLLIKTRK